MPNGSLVQQLHLDSSEAVDRGRKVGAEDSKGRRRYGVLSLAKERDPLDPSYKYETTETRTTRETGLPVRKTGERTYGKPDIVYV